MSDHYIVIIEISACLITDIPEAHHLYNYAQSIDITNEQFMIDPQDTSVGGIFYQTAISF